MQRFQGAVEFLQRVLGFFKKNIKIVIVVLAILFIAGAIIREKQVAGTGSTVKAASKINDKELQKLISENKTKYAPKYDWLKTHPQTLPVSTKSAAVLDYNTGQLLFADNEHAKLPPASITKVLTTIVVLENMDKNALCKISKEAAETEPYKIVLEEGEQMKVEDLVYGMMMLSANDAAEVLAECYEGGKPVFIEKMNEKVKLIGLTDTHFVTPNGLDDPNHYSSAYDMVAIANYGIKSVPGFLNYFGRNGEYSVPPTEHNGPHWWSQISTLLHTYPGMDGAKTGFTYDAGNTYVATAMRNGRRVIISYFNANSTTYDATLLLDQGFALDPTN